MLWALEMPADAQNGSSDTKHETVKDGDTSARLLALDAFRGLTIALMLLVNNFTPYSAAPAQLLHAPWGERIRMADLVFPWFLFCVGVSIPFAAASFRRKALPAWRYDLKVLGRTTALLLLGMLLESSIQHRVILSLGVLQLIGLAYLVGAWLYELPLTRRMIIAGGMLVVYWAAIKYLPIPAMGAGLVEESQNLIWYVNRTFFNGLRIGPFELSLWGLPSVMPTAALVMIGAAIGDLLRRRDMTSIQKSIVLLVSSLALTFGGIGWSYSLFFSKTLWTPSYILFCAGTGTMLLGLFYLLIDVKSWRKWSYPLLVFGSNAILAYVVPILVKVTILKDWQVYPQQTLEQWMLASLSPLHDAVAGGCIYTILYITVWWIVLWLLYRKRIFLRI